MSGRNKWDVIVLKTLFPSEHSVGIALIHVQFKHELWIMLILQKLYPLQQCHEINITLEREVNTIPISVMVAALETVSSPYCT